MTPEIDQTEIKTLLDKVAPKKVKPSQFSFKNFTDPLVQEFATEHQHYAQFIFGSVGCGKTFAGFFKLFTEGAFKGLHFSRVGGEDVIERKVFITTHTQDAFFTVYPELEKCIKSLGGVCEIKRGSQHIHGMVKVAVQLNPDSIVYHERVNPNDPDDREQWFGPLGHSETRVVITHWQLFTTSKDGFASGALSSNIDTIYWNELGRSERERSAEELGKYNGRCHRNNGAGGLMGDSNAPTKDSPIFTQTGFYCWNADDLQTYKDGFTYEPKPKFKQWVLKNHLPHVSNRKEWSNKNIPNNDYYELYLAQNGGNEQEIKRAIENIPVERHIGTYAAKEFSLAKHIIENFEPEPGRRIFIGMDQDDNGGLSFAQVLNNGQEVIYKTIGFEDSNSDDKTDFICEELDHLGVMEASICIDPAAYHIREHSKRKESTMVNHIMHRAQNVHGKKLIFETPFWPSNEPEDERNECLMKRFRNQIPQGGKFPHRLVVSERNKPLIDALLYYPRKQNSTTGVWKNDKSSPYSGRFDSAVFLAALLEKVQGNHKSNTKNDDGIYEEVDFGAGIKLKMRVTAHIPPTPKEKVVIIRPNSSI